jgi:succinate dehydrogenase / fumarate reductase cytochrome b subunit
MLSIASRLAGIFVTALTMPAMFVYLLALAAGPDAYASYMALLTSLPGKLFCLVSLFCLCYHLANGIRHLVWDTGRALSLKSIYSSGYLMLAGAVILFLLVAWRVVA